MLLAQQKTKVIVRPSGDQDFRAPGTLLPQGHGGPKIMVVDRLLESLQNLPNGIGGVHQQGLMKDQDFRAAPAFGAGLARSKDVDFRAPKPPRVIKVYPSDDDEDDDDSDSPLVLRKKNGQKVAKKRSRTPKRVTLKRRDEVEGSAGQKHHGKVTLRARGEGREEIDSSRQLSRRESPRGGGAAVKLQENKRSRRERSRTPEARRRPDASSLNANSGGGGDALSRFLDKRFQRSKDDT